MQHTRNISDDRLSLNDAMIVFIDHQSGLFQLARSSKIEELRNNVVALASAANLFRLPVILTTNVEQGPNGPLIPELRERLRSAAFVPRPGQVNPFDNQNFVRMIRSTGRRQLILAGVPTDVSVAQTAITAVKMGYQVFVVTDASGSLTKETHATALLRMIAAGVQPLSWYGMVGELAQDWRRDPEGLSRLFAEHITPYRDLLVSFEAQRGGLMGGG